MTRAALLASAAVLLGAAIIAAAIALKPNAFETCEAAMLRAIERHAVAEAVTLDPRDMAADAARRCSGVPSGV